MTTKFIRCTPLMMVLSLLICRGTIAQTADDPRDLKIWKELGASTQVDFNLVPLRDMADYISDYHRIAIYLDTEAFEKEGVVHKSLAFTHKSENQPLWKVLRDTLKPSGLSFMIKNHTLTITTATAAREWQMKNITGTSRRSRH